MSQKYLGGFITKSPVAPTSSAASGMWTLDQAMQLQKQGNWPSPPLVIGQVFGGGFFAGQISTTANGLATHNLVVGPVSSAQSDLQWKTSQTSTAGTSSVIDGPTNSANMNNASHPCAQFCEAVTVGGYTDWYMPAKNELEVCYFNLKPFTNNNVTTSGINANAVPARASNYTTIIPAQTTSADFKDTGAEDFDQNNYWSSTENTATYAWRQGFNNGAQYGYYKTTSHKVRAIRRVAV